MGTEAGAIKKAGNKSRYVEGKFKKGIGVIVSTTISHRSYLVRWKDDTVERVDWGDVNEVDITTLTVTMSAQEALTKAEHRLVRAAARRWKERLITDYHFEQASAWKNKQKAAMQADLAKVANRELTTIRSTFPDWSELQCLKHVNMKVDAYRKARYG